MPPFYNLEKIMPKNESSQDESVTIQPTLEELFAFEATVNANIQREKEEQERAEVMARYGLTDGKKKGKSVTQQVQEKEPEQPMESSDTSQPALPPTPPNPFATE
jgi:hypothetical protein